jgi:ADP-ribose pyrophosphatase
MTFKTIGKETVFKGRAFSVERQFVRKDDQSETIFEVVVHPGAVTILPLDADGQIWFVRQYRYGAGQNLLELPAGTLENGEEPAQSAGREIREEIGMAAGKLEKLGEFFLAPGYSSEYMHVYLATDLYPSPLEKDDDEFLEVVKIPAARVIEMARNGEIPDGKTLAALLLAANHPPLTL